MDLGKVSDVYPKGPHTHTALQAGKNGTLVDAINKMAEYDYRLLEGTSLVMDVSLGGAFLAVFMYRDRLTG